MERVQCPEEISINIFGNIFESKRRTGLIKIKASSLMVIYKAVNSFIKCFGILKIGGMSDSRYFN